MTGLQAPPYHVNMPLSWVKQNPKWLDLMALHGLHPELGLDEIALSLPRSWHKNTIKRLDDFGMTRVSHLPFYLPGIGSEDPAAYQVTRDMLLRGAELAALYSARHMVGHPCFQPEDRQPESDKNWPEPNDAWLERSAWLWEAVLKASPAKLFLENTREELSPLPVTRLIDRLPERAAMCFDVGHWHAFAHGAERNNLEQWIEACASHIGHLHLHDNHGLEDEHLGMGHGSIPFELFFQLLKKHNVHATVTLEPHSMDDYQQSAKWLHAHSDALPSIAA